MFILILIYELCFSAKKDNLIMDFFLGENVHNGFNLGKEVAKKLARQNKTN